MEFIVLDPNREIKLYEVEEPALAIYSHLDKYYNDDFLPEEKTGVVYNQTQREIFNPNIDPHTADLGDFTIEAISPVSAILEDYQIWFERAHKKIIIKRTADNQFVAIHYNKSELYKTMNFAEMKDYVNELFKAHYFILDVKLTNDEEE